MCDCYTIKCENCETRMSIHVADWCVEREAVHALCPACVKTRWNRDHEDGIACCRIFVDTVADRGQVVTADNWRNEDGAWESSGPFKSIGRKGQVVLLWSTDDGAYGIHLN